MRKKVSLPLQCRWLKATSFLLMCSERQWKVRRRTEKVGHWTELGRTASRSTWRPGNLDQHHLAQHLAMDQCHQGQRNSSKSRLLSATFMRSIWLHHPNSSRQKERTANRLKLNHSARDEFILTLPTGFSSRGLAKQIGVMLLYIGGFHCCSYEKGNRKREISGTWLALLLHEAILLLFTTVPQAVNHNGCHWKYLSRRFCTDIFSLQSGQTHLTLCRGTLQNLSWHSEGILTEAQNIFSLIC